MATERASHWRWVVGPALISLAVTLLRLAGELAGGSPRWFSRDTGGIVPSGFSWIVGITWLALPFGAWFAWKLLDVGAAPRRPGRAFAVAVAALALLYGGLRLGLPLVKLPFPYRLLPIWLCAALAAALAWSAWPALARLLALYGLAARAPVAVVMFLAMRGAWGTHYDYVDWPATTQLPFWPRYFWLAFAPQLVFWVGYTVMAGTAAGSLVALLRRPAR